jgi:hypothetical protein
MGSHKREKKRELKWFGMERGSCLLVSTYTQNGRYTKKTTFILFVSSAFISSSSRFEFQSLMHKSQATLMGNLLNSGHLFWCHSRKNLFIVNDKSTKRIERKNPLDRTKKVKIQHFPFHSFVTIT